ncbi:MAG: Mov34/MPN/PAD-1 family protein [Polyangiaceae bacterium]
MSMKPNQPSVRGAVFRPVNVERSVLPCRARASARAGYQVYRGKNGFEAAIPEHIVERLSRWCEKLAPLEAYGLLVGRAFKDKLGLHVVVLGIVPDPDAKAERFFIETTPTSEFRTRMSAAQFFPDCIVLGWVHSHPRIGAQYSGVDRENQATWKAPFSLGVVVDAWDPVPLGVYRGPESELLTQVEIQERTGVPDANVTEAPCDVDATEHDAPGTHDAGAQAVVTRETPAVSPADLAGAAVEESVIASTRQGCCSHGATLSLLVYVVIVLTAIFGAIALCRTHSLDDRVTRLEAAAARDQEVVDEVTVLLLKSALPPEEPNVCNEPNQSHAP